MLRRTNSTIRHPATRRSATRRSSSTYSTARTMRSTGSRMRSPDSDPDEFVALLWQLTTPITRGYRQPRPEWTAREARAAMQAFLRKTKILHDTPVWADPAFQRELGEIRTAATGRITRPALAHAFRALQAFADKWYSQMTIPLLNR
jgi:hypothetical protein